MVSSTNIGVASNPVNAKVQGKYEYVIAEGSNPGTIGQFQVYDISDRTTPVFKGQTPIGKTKKIR